MQKVWFRSVATIQDSKMPERAKIIRGDFGQQKDNKNGYVLFETKEAALAAKLALNQTKFQDKHIRVDLSAPAQEGARASTDDYSTTVFIGNLPFIVNEEELRAFFVGCGDIENVRVVRDPKTFIGKGIGYVMFKTKESMQKAIADREGSKFKGRDLRVKRAVDPKRREKKQRKKQTALEERRQKRLEKEQ